MPLGKVVIRQRSSTDFRELAKGQHGGGHAGREAHLVARLDGVDAAANWDLARGYSIRDTAGAKRQKFYRRLRSMLHELGWSRKPGKLLREEWTKKDDR